MNPELYKPAEDGNLDDLKQQLDSLIQNNSRLHEHLTATNCNLLHVLSQFNDSPECVLEILCRLNSEDQKLMLNRQNSGGETPLHIASRNGRSEIVRALIERAQALDREDVESGAKTSSEEMMRVIDQDGDTALHKAVWNRHKDVVELLVSNDPDFEHPLNKMEETPLYLAVERDYHGIRDLILTTCTSPRYEGPGRKTALHAAVLNDCTDCTTKLLQKNLELALTKRADEFGWTPLHYAAYTGSLALAIKLLEADRSMAYMMTRNKDDDNKTPLHIAVCRGYHSVMEELLKYCPDCWDMVTSKGQNVLQLSLTNNGAALKFILDQRWAINLINQKDEEGNTPLHLYTTGVSKFWDESDLVKMVKHPQADVNAVNKAHLTPLDLALKLPDSKQTARILEVLFYSGAERGSRKSPSIDDADERRREEKAKRKRAEEKQRRPDDFKEKAHTHVLVATLIATVTFAAGFTLPGGYDGNAGPNQGMAVLIRKAAFKTFVVTDAIAVTFSFLAIFLHFSTSMRDGEYELYEVYKLYSSALISLLIAMIAMVIAFFTGLYTVLGSSSFGLGISLCILGCFPILVISYKLQQVVGLRGLLRFVGYVSGWNSFWAWNVRGWIRVHSKKLFTRIRRWIRPLSKIFTHHTGLPI